MLKKSTRLLIDRHRGHDPKIGGVTRITGDSLKRMKAGKHESAHRKNLAKSLRQSHRLAKGYAANQSSGAAAETDKITGRMRDMRKFRGHA